MNFAVITLDLSWQGEEDEENDGEQEEEGDGFFVPHGYLSEGEGCDDDDDERKVILTYCDVAETDKLMWNFYSGWLHRLTWVCSFVLTCFLA